MSTAEDLLNGESSEYLEIDSDLRTIKIPAEFKILGVYNDMNVRRLYFRMPRYYDEIDLGEYDISINYRSANYVLDRYIVVDKLVDDDEITFSWLVGRIAFLEKGSTYFNVCLRIIDDEAVVINEFNTTVYALTVLEGLEATVDPITPEERDVVQQFMNEWNRKFEGLVPQRGRDYWTDDDLEQIDEDISEKVDARVGREYEVMDKEDYDALTEYEVDKLYMVRW